MFPTHQNQELGRLTVNTQRFLLVLLFVLLTSPANLQAQELRIRGEDQEISKIHVTMFVGGSTEAEPQLGGTSLTIGGDVEYRPFDLVGTGVVVDIAVGDIKRDVLIAVPFFLHMTRYFRLTMGPRILITCVPNASKPRIR